MANLCVICARGGSEGVPGKNIRLLLGKPLLVWSIEQAFATPDVDRVVVSTDSTEIAKVAVEGGAAVPFMRPARLSGSEVGKFQVWQHALEACEAHYGEKYQMFVDLDCTGPLREVEDISDAIAQFQKKPHVDAVFSVCSARKNPYFNLVEADKNGALRMSKTIKDRILCRQDAPVVFEHIGSIYVLDPDYLRKNNHLLDGHAEGFDIGPWKGFDIDSEIDFRIVEMLMKARKYERISG